MAQMQAQQPYDRQGHQGGQDNSTENHINWSKVVLDDKYFRRVAKVDGDRKCTEDGFFNLW